MRQHEIQQHGVGHEILNLQKCLLPIRGDFNDVPIGFQLPFIKTSHQRIVVYDQNFFLGSFHWFGESEIEVFIGYWSQGFIDFRFALGSQQSSLFHEENFDTFELRFRSN